MKLKKFIIITSIVTLVALTVGFVSFFSFSNNLSQSIFTLPLVNIKDGNNAVKITPEGEFIQDDENTISIGWNGIKIGSDSNEDVNINWGNIYLNNKNISTVNLNETKSTKVDNITDISIDSSFVPIKVIPTDLKEIEVTLKGSITGNVNPKLVMNTVNNKLEIKVENNKSSYSIMNSNAVLTIKLPSDYKKHLKVVSSSADIFMKDLNIDTLSIVTSSGDMDLSNITANSISSTASSGDTTIDNISGKLLLISSSGDIELNLKNNNEFIEIESSSGDVDIYFNDDSNYSVSGKTSSGTIELPYKASIDNQNEKDFQITLGNGKNKIDIKTSSGDITLE